MRLLFKNYKRNDKHFDNCGYSLFFLMNIFYKQSFGGVLQKNVSLTGWLLEATIVALW